jgi:hypothetical protein
MSRGISISGGPPVRISRAPTVRSAPSGGVPTGPAGRAGAVAREAAERPRALRVCRCDRRSSGRCSRHRYGRAASGGSSAALKQPVRDVRKQEHGEQGGQADPGRGRVRHASFFETRAQRSPLLHCDVCGVDHRRRCPLAPRARSDQVRRFGHRMHPRRRGPVRKACSHLAWIRCEDDGRGARFAWWKVISVR